MRIVVVSNLVLPAGQGGAEAYAHALSARLAQRHEVIVMRGEGGEVPGARTLNLPHRPPLAHDRASSAKALWHLREQWMPSVHVATRRALSRFRPDVVHTHEPQGLSAAVFTAIAAEGVPHVHTAHDYNLLCLRTSFFRNGQRCDRKCNDCRLQRAVRTRAIKRRLDLLLAPSKYLRDAHVEAGVVARDRAIAFQHAPLEPPVRTRVREPLAGPLRLGFVGTLSDHKGVSTLLEAMSRLPGAWSLRMAGSGPLAPLVRQRAQIDPRIEYLGYVRGDAKERFFDDLDLLVVPSVWEEPAGLVAVEAGARGLPAVVSDVGGLREAPEAIRFNPGDVGALVAVLSSLSTDTRAITEASRSLLARARENHWTTHVDEMERWLRSAARSPASPVEKRP